MRLGEFWAASNLLQSFEEIEKALADKKELDTVYFEMNPLQLKNPVLYRNKVRLALPQVQQIDASMNPFLGGLAKMDRLMVLAFVRVS